MAEFARLSTFTVESGRADDAVAFFDSTDLREAARASGFRRAFWLLDRDSGKGAELIVFESRAALEGAEGEEEKARGSAAAAGVNLASEEIYEVVAEGKPS